MTAEAEDFRRRYAAALHAAIAGGGESALSAAYELGRDAVRRRLSVLDLAAVHHESLADELRSASAGTTGERTVRAAGPFFVESLSAYEMLARVLVESHEVARLERRHALLLRQLSGFLADASLAIDANASLQEVLQLIAEHALEVVDADACSARLAPADHDAVVDAEALASGGAPDSALRERLTGLYGALRPDGGSLRLGAAELAEHVPGARLAWLAAPLTALDGRVIGLLHLFAFASERKFSTMDEAVLVQLAQMASASFERMDLYRR
jgi:hypothetical protein